MGFLWVCDVDTLGEILTKLVKEGKLKLQVFDWNYSFCLAPVKRDCGQVSCVNESTGEDDRNSILSEIFTMFIRKQKLKLRIYEYDYSFRLVFDRYKPYMSGREMEENNGWDDM